MSIEAAGRSQTDQAALGRDWISTMADQTRHRISGLGRSLGTRMGQTTYIHESGSRVEREEYIFRNFVLSEHLGVVACCLGIVGYLWFEFGLTHSDFTLGFQ